MSCENNSPPQHQQCLNTEDGWRCNCMDGSLMRFPPGYRFQPLDEELLLHYLKKKANGERLPYQEFMSHKIRDVELYAHNPEALIENHKLDCGEKDWYFFTPRDRKYRNGSRPNRAAGDGYWKATGADKKIYVEGNLVGFRKALVFYKGKPPKGDKTSWIMHEFTVASPHPSDKSKSKNTTGNNTMRLDPWVLCKIYKKVDKVQTSGERVREREDGEEVQQPLVENEVLNPEMHISDRTNTVSASTVVTPAPIESPRFSSFQPDPRYINGSQGNLHDVVFRGQPLPRVNNNLIHNNGGNNNMFAYQPQIMMGARSTMAADCYPYYSNPYLNYEFGRGESHFQSFPSMDLMTEQCPLHCNSKASSFPFKSGFANKMHGDKQDMISFPQDEFKFVPRNNPEMQQTLPPLPVESDPKSHSSFDSPGPYPTMKLNDSPSSPAS